MKTIIKSIFVLLSVLLFYSFVINGVFGEKPKTLQGTKQIFVNSTKQIEYTESPMSVFAFNNKVNDSITEGFQMYTFNFDKNTLGHHYYDFDENDSIIDLTYTLDIKVVKNDGYFAIINVIDKTNYYNDINDKVMIVNLKDNPRYPKLQIVWKDGDSYSGVYSVDTRDFNELFTDSKTSIFEK